ncbi:hypothetical protein KV564_02820 [Paenibacillus chitinolyticus]|nr:hypothetical protein [Paenibacillus chitinolyticus]
MVQNPRADARGRPLRPIFLYGRIINGTPDTCAQQTGKLYARSFADGQTRHLYKKKTGARGSGLFITYV